MSHQRVSLAAWRHLVVNKVPTTFSTDALHHAGAGPSIPVMGANLLGTA